MKKAIQFFAVVVSILTANCAMVWAEVGTVSICCYGKNMTAQACCNQQRLYWCQNTQTCFGNYASYGRDCTDPEQVKCPVLGGKWCNANASCYPDVDIASYYFECADVTKSICQNEGRPWCESMGKCFYNTYLYIRACPIQADECVGLGGVYCAADGTCFNSQNDYRCSDVSQADCVAQGKSYCVAESKCYYHPKTYFEECSSATKAECEAKSPTYKWCESQQKCYHRSFYFNCR